MNALAIDPALHWTLRLALAAILGFASVPKLRDPAGFRSAVAGYRLLPANAVATVAAALAIVEASAALALLVPGAAGIAIPVVLALLATYTAAIAANLARGRRDIDCGCSGPAGRRPLSGSLLLRNAILASAALACLLPASARASHLLDVFTVACGAGALFCLYVGYEVIAANGERLRLMGAS
jgi:hypothetical protein